MRTKNAKRLWPVPATLAVMALAALLAFGLMVTNGPQPVAAQSADCSVNQAGTTTPADGSCPTTGNSAVIELTNNNTAAKQTFHVFAENIASADASGPTVFPLGTTYTNGAFRVGSAATDAVAKPLKYLAVEVPERRFNDGSARVTVTGNVGTSTVVYVFTAFPTVTDIADAPSSAAVDTALPSGSGNLSVTFLGAPVRSAPDDHGAATGAEDADTRPEPRSNLVVADVATATIAANNDVAITVTATVQDINGNNLQGRITYTVTYAADSDLKSGQMSYTTQPEDFPAAGGTTHTHSVAGWAASTEPVKVDVTANFTGATGSLELPLVITPAADDTVTPTSLSRIGPAETIVADVYSGDCIQDQQDTQTPDVLTDDSFVMAGNSDCTMPSKFGSEEMVVVKAHLIDGLGSMTASPSLTVALASSDAPLDTDDAVVLAAPPTNTLVWIYTVDEDAMIGSHDITVSTAAGTIDDKVLPVVVAGPPVKFSIDGPKYIAPGEDAKFTVTAKDKADGVPYITAANDMVPANVSFSPPNAASVEGVSGGMIELDASGMATITVDGFGAPAGVMGRIRIGADDMRVEHTFTFGTAPTVPGMPMNVSAMATSDTMIDVSWDVPSDGGSAITGYIIERRYTGDMVSDITSDGYNAAAGGASFAFSNHMEWWETLNCKGMLQAAGSSEDPAGNGPDKMKYCQHYANTAPTNMAGTIMAGDATDMDIQALFDKRFVITGNIMSMYTDTGLMAETEYTYRVSAVNAEGRSAWSAAAMATTEATPTPPMASGMLADVSLTVGDADEMVDASGAFTMTDGDAITSYDASSSDDTVATASADAMGMVTISAVGAGSATVSVTATDKDGMSDAVEIDVTVMAAPVVLGAPMNVREVLNTAGSLVVGWDVATGADGYLIIAVDTADNSAISRVLIGGDHTSGGLDSSNGLMMGHTYHVFVASYDSNTNKLSDLIEVTVN